MKVQGKNRKMVMAVAAVMALMPFMGEAQAEQSRSSSLGVIIYPAKGQPAQQAKSSTIQHFNKAFGACMEGRGYTVK